MATNLVKQMIEQYQYPVLNELPIDDFLEQHEEVVLFFSEDPDKYPESNDVAMILPELLKAFDNRFAVALVGPDIQRDLQKLYGFLKWPALVFFRNSGYLGHICKVQDWHDYLQEIQQILTNKPKPAQGFIIPIQQ